MIHCGIKPGKLFDRKKGDEHLSGFVLTSGQIQALGDILIGKTPALGQNPLINLP